MLLGSPNPSRPAPQEGQLTHLLLQRQEIQTNDSRARAENENRQQRIAASAEKITQLTEKVCQFENEMRQIDEISKQGR